MDYTKSDLINEDESIFIERRRHNRLLSFENTTLTEVITVYENLKKAKENQVVNNKVRGRYNINFGFNVADKTEPTIPNFNLTVENSMESKKTLSDFTQFKYVKPRKYLYFSLCTNLLLSDTLEELSPNYSELLQMKKYWLNINCPTEQDFFMLSHSYGVNDLTITDIREKNSEEKLEVFKNYTFLSLKFFIEENKEKVKITTFEDVDLNILIFEDFVITIHNKEWPSITNILGFLSLIFKHVGETLNPDWILFSVFMELHQDAKDFMEFIEREVNKIRMSINTTIGVPDASILRQNFSMELQIYGISRFIKPKIHILNLLKKKCTKRIDGIIMKLLSDIVEDFREINQDITHYNHVLERSQDTFLALVTSDQTRESNEINKIMKRISEIALVFLPIQAISSCFGMNMTVPYQSTHYPSEIYFYSTVGICILVGIALFFMRKIILSY